VAKSSDEFKNGRIPVHCGVQVAINISDVLVEDYVSQTSNILYSYKLTHCSLLVRRVG